MTRICRRGFLRFLVALAGVVFPGGAHAAEDVWTGVDRVVAVGDAHGDYEQFVAVLRSAGLIGTDGRWTGGKAHLVQVGDVLDRGTNSRKIMDLLMRLESEARKAGGYVHALIGNHEAMNLGGDWRYVPPEEFAAYADEESAAERREDVAAGHPPGYEARQREFSEDGKYGKWIRGHDAIIRINDTVFLHGGISAKYADFGLRQINDEIRAELRDPSKLEGGMAVDDDGPLWYRGLALGDEKALGPVVDQALATLKAKRIVVGHTVTEAAVMSRFGGKVLLIDVGLSRFFDPVGRQACLVIEKGAAYALHRGTKLALPKDEGKDLLRYLQQAAALDPPPSPLLAEVARVEASLAAAK